MTGFNSFFDSVDHLLHCFMSPAFIVTVQRGLSTDPKLPKIDFLYC